MSLRKAWERAERDPNAARKLPARLRVIHGALAALDDGRVDQVEAARDAAEAAGASDVAHLLALLLSEPLDPTWVRKQAKREAVHRHTGAWWLDVVRMVAVRRDGDLKQAPAGVKKAARTRPFLSEVVTALGRKTMPRRRWTGGRDMQVVFAMAGVLGNYIMASRELKLRFGRDDLDLDHPRWGVSEWHGELTAMLAGRRPVEELPHLGRTLRDLPPDDRARWLHRVLTALGARLADAAMADLRGLVAYGRLLCGGAHPGIRAQLDALDLRLAWFEGAEPAEALVESAWEHGGLETAALDALAQDILHAEDPTQRAWLSAWRARVRAATEPAELIALADVAHELEPRLPQTLGPSVPAARIQLITALVAVNEPGAVGLTGVPALVDAGVEPTHVAAVVRSWLEARAPVRLPPPDRRMLARAAGSLAPLIGDDDVAEAVVSLYPFIGSLPPACREALAALEVGSTPRDRGRAIAAAVASGDPAAARAQVRVEGRALRGRGAAGTARALEVVGWTLQILPLDPPEPVLDVLRPLTAYILRDGPQAAADAPTNEAGIDVGLHMWATANQAALRGVAYWRLLLGTPSHEDMLAELKRLVEAGSFPF